MAERSLNRRYSSEQPTNQPTTNQICEKERTTDKTACTKGIENVHGKNYDIKTIFISFGQNTAEVYEHTLKYVEQITTYARSGPVCMG